MNKRFLRVITAYNRVMHDLIDAGLVKEHGTIDIDWDKSPSNDQEETATPEDNNHDESDNS